MPAKGCIGFDYYPFGMLMPGRKYSAGNGYRYGFNGKEKDNEVKGEGNQQDYGMRIYDPRLGRFLSVDPIMKNYPELTPYQFAGNSPILCIDLDGLEPLPWYLRENKNGGKPVLTLGLGNLPTTTKVGYGGHPWWSDQAISTFVHNTLVVAWNGVAGTWNGAMDGQTGTDMLRQTVQTLEKAKPSDLKKVSTWEDLAGAAVTFYVAKKLFSFEFSPTATNTIRGTWVAENTKGWSTRTIEYQEQITGVKAGNALQLELNGVKAKFDGHRGNTILLEAKSSYDNFVNKKTGQFESWFKGKEGLLDEAQRQIKVANGIDIEWHFSSQKTLDATKSYLESQGITKGITYKYTPQH